jgi:putative transposase
MLKTSAQLRLENLALRQQLTVLRRSAPKRLRLTPADRIFWVWLRRVWSDWKSALMIVKAETVVAWHRKGFRLFWTWRIRRGKPGRPTVSQEVRDLIRMMSRNNPRRGAPRIHGELLKLDMLPPSSRAFGFFVCTDEQRPGSPRCRPKAGAVF